LNRTRSAAQHARGPRSSSRGGVAFGHQDRLCPVDFATMLGAADEALYAVKHSGRNSVRVAVAT